MQGAASPIPARRPAVAGLSTGDLDASAAQLAHAKGSILATVLNALLWVGLFGLASILTLPR